MITKEAKFFKDQKFLLLYLYDEKQFNVAAVPDMVVDRNGLLSLIL